MRLQPITKPNSWLIRLAYFLSRRTFGKVLSAFQVIYARSTPILRVMLKIIQTEKKLSLDTPTKLLIKSFVSNLNDCPFCSNTNEYLAIKGNINKQKINSLLNYRESDLFTAREKAMMEYLESVTYTKNASDDCYQQLQQYFNDKEIVEVTWLCAVENYFNMQAKPLGLPSDALNA
ncbi:carboxymuconolactone decarboxylase family protein [Chitinophaga silvatica]|nr:carboxymuconolactone decarboxylase family protein [Chitinophaga silvatica]